MSFLTSEDVTPSQDPKTGTIAAIHCVAIIMLKNTMGFGRIVPNAEILLKQKCMFITKQMNTILRSLKIHQPMNPQSALSVV